MLYSQTKVARGLANFSLYRQIFPSSLPRRCWVITAVHLLPMASMRKSSQQIFGYRLFPPISTCFGDIWNANRVQLHLELILAQYTRTRQILLLPKGHGRIFWTTVTTPHHTSLSIQEVQTWSDARERSVGTNTVRRRLLRLLGYNWAMQVSHLTIGRNKRLAAAFKRRATKAI